MEFYSMMPIGGGDILQTLILCQLFFFGLDRVQSHPFGVFASRSDAMNLARSFRAGVQSPLVIQGSRFLVENTM